jgi:hypothetical protein
VTGSSKSVRYLRFIGLAIVIVVALVAVGALPTRRLAGEGALPAMLVGCGISLAAAALAGALLVTVNASTPKAQMQRAFQAMIARLVVVAVLGVLAVFSGVLARTPLLFWVAMSYVALLPLEVRLAIASE